MDVYEVKSLEERLVGNRYPGRGIVVGKTPDGKHAAIAYFIMGRSANSRNRIFAERDGALYTEPYDASKVEDPSLIIYAAVRRPGELPDRHQRQPDGHNLRWPCCRQELLRGSF